MTVELIQGLLLAFALVVILMPPYIRLLQGIGFGKRIRQEGPESHFSKEGTPTMGGLLIVLVVLGIYFFLRQPDAATFAPLAALAGVGALGAFDDYLNARTGEGIKARQKLIWLTVVAFVAAYQIQQTYAITAIAVPFYGPLPIEPWLYVGFAAFAIIAAANGVNITDGLDGLSGGTVAIAFVAYMLIALLTGGLSLPQAILALLPEAPSVAAASDRLTAFHEAMSVFLGACDGPAAIVDPRRRGAASCRSRPRDTSSLLLAFGPVRRQVQADERSDPRPAQAERSSEAKKRSNDIRI